MLSFNCPHCQKGLRANDDAGGSTLACPKCHQKFVVPEAQAGLDLSEFSSGPVGTRMSVSVPKKFNECRAYLATISFVVKFTGVMLALLTLPALYAAYVIGTQSGNKTLFIGALFACFAWLGLVYLYYLSVMCAVEFVEATIETEHNTRTSAAWLERVANANS